MTARGYSLIECMVAIAIIGFVASAVAQTVILTQQRRQVSENWMRATELALQRIEAVRAGSMTDSQPMSGIFRRDSAFTGVTGHPGLLRLDVTVGWTDPDPHQMTLSTLVRP